MTPPRRIPTKKELERLQRQYKTDERIADRLGNVQPYLVTYWRRKRNVPNYSAPKFAEDEIRSLWERFGDDERCGTELGISRPAFYNWRRRYEIREKPAFLKLEQMEFQFPGKEFSAQRAKNYGKRTAVHKLLWEKCEGRQSAIGAEISVSPDLIALTSGGISSLCSSDSANKLTVQNPAGLALGLGPVFSGDGFQSKRFDLRRWANKQKITQIFGVRDGHFWERLAERGTLLPGKLVVCEAGQERFAGATGALGWSVDSENLLKLLSGAELKIKTPSVSRVILTGKRYTPISATDITLLLLSQISSENISGSVLDGSVLEFAGKSLTAFSIADRQTLCAVPSLSGIHSALTPFDTLTRKHCAALGSWSYSAVVPDNDAEYQNTFQLNIELVQPMVARKAGGNNAGSSRRGQARLDFDSSATPSSVGNSVPGLTLHTAEELADTRVDIVFIGGSPGGHFEQLRRAADILSGKQGAQIADHVTLVVSPISRSSYLMALKKGVLRQFVECGAIIANPGIDSESLRRFGVTEDQIVATTCIESRFATKVRPSDRYIVSPASAAAAALTGSIVDPRGV